MLGAKLMGKGQTTSLRQVHRWLGRFLAIAAGLLATLGLYITYIFSIRSDSPTSVVFMFLVALFVILFFTQAVWEARKHRISRHLDALVFAMIFLSLPASGRLIEAAMRSLGVENTRSLELVSVGFGYQVELVDLTILMIAAVPILVWGIYAVPRGVLAKNPAKLWIAIVFFALPLLAVIAQSVVRMR